MTGETYKVENLKKSNEENTYEGKYSEFYSYE